MTLSFSGANLESASVHKHLKWNNHVDDINARADKRLFQLEALRFKLNRETIKKLYLSYIRPIVKYSDVAFTNILVQLPKWWPCNGHSWEFFGRNGFYVPLRPKLA